MFSTLRMNSTLLSFLTSHQTYTHFRHKLTYNPNQTHIFLGCLSLSLSFPFFLIFVCVFFFVYLPRFARNIPVQFSGKILIKSNPSGTKCNKILNWIYIFKCSIAGIAGISIYWRTKLKRRRTKNKMEWNSNAQNIRGSRRRIAISS